MDMPNTKFEAISKRTTIVAYELAIVVVLVGTGCSSNRGRDVAGGPGNRASATPVKAPPVAPVLAVGGTAYLRAPSKNDKSGVSFAFGEAVTLVKAVEDKHSRSWVVSKGKKKDSLDEKLLTPNLAEIEFLKAHAIVPQYWVLMSVDDGGALVNNGDVFYNMDYTMPDGTVLHNPKDGLTEEQLNTSKATISQRYDMKGYAIMFEDDAVKLCDKEAVKGINVMATMGLFDSQRQPFTVRSSCMYFCTADGEKPAFECIDLKALKITK